MFQVPEGIAWDEPLLFKIRTIGIWGWIIRSVVVLMLFSVMTLGTYMAPPKKDRPLPALPMVLCYNLFIAFAMVAFPEYPNIQRRIVVTENEIWFIGRFEPKPLRGVFHVLMGGLRVWNRKEIQRLQLLRRGEQGNNFPYALLKIIPKYSKPRLIAVLNNVNLDLIADFLSSHNYIFSLSNWPTFTVEPSSAHESFE